MILETYTTRADWLDARRGSLGGSDVAAVLGLSPWRSALEVWAQLRGMVGPTPESLSMRRGQALEPLVVEEVVREAGVLAEYPLLGIARREDRPGEHFSPDALLLDDGARFGSRQVVGLLEAKSTSRAEDWHDAAPAWVWAQVQHGLDICDLEEGIAGCLLTTRDEIRWQRIARDPSWATDWRPRIVEFLGRVASGDAPDPDGSDSAGRVLASLPRDERRARFLDADQAARVARWRELDDARLAAKSEARIARQLVIADLGTARVGLLPDGGAVSFSRGRLLHHRRAPRGLEIIEEFS